VALRCELMSLSDTNSQRSRPAGAPPARAPLNAAVLGARTLERVTCRLLPLALVTLALAACGGDSPRPDAAQTPTPAPDPAAALPTTAAALADDLTTTSRSLRDAIIAWRRDGDPGSGDAPAGVAALAARVERIHRALVPRRRLTDQTLRLLNGRVRAEARDVIAARRALDVLNEPRPGQKPPSVRRGPPEPADALRSHYRKARARSGVSVTLLAAVNLIESDFGRVRNDSVAGAQGPMQFIPSTWRAYGRGGDVQDPHDAILGAARFLAAAGALGDEAGALYRYNPSSLYVTAVSRYARVMRREPLAYYAFYASGAGSP
jgi:membrane-bound lytic murein transglycosylase B